MKVGSLATDVIGASVARPGVPAHRAATHDDPVPRPAPCVIPGSVRLEPVGAVRSAVRWTQPVSQSGRQSGCGQLQRQE